MNKRNIFQLEGVPSSKFLRDTAQLLLKYADALDAGKVTVVNKPFVTHVFSGRIKGGFLKEADEMPDTIKELHQCNHNIEKLFFLLALAHCPITGEFFISEEATKVLREQIEHFNIHP